MHLNGSLPFRSSNSLKRLYASANIETWRAVGTNTSTLPPAAWASRTPRNTALSCRFIEVTTKACGTCACVCRWSGVPATSTITVSGRIESLATALISSEKVAENISVWRKEVSGSLLKSNLTKSRFSKSRSRSASSKTTPRTPWQFICWCLINAATRPGVATRISGVLISSSAWTSMFSPPVTMPTSKRGFKKRHNFLASAAICSASGRVGEMMSTETLSLLAGKRSARSMAGIRNANVLPVPVCDLASTSNPCNAGPIVIACTGVIDSYL
mmetsp:Transcript_99430/g.186804  ORF Transcript_99430/g.186804 Transcript_99430/m.186804 type:complete len:272 (+) Transcript_99430:736-1551(+)